mmetsp:Transcript_15891/g.34502  ORF Transcript_15891/g.34502 Transcript_15891/m.34502 type:complete len:94 (+) Transcript_15891:420-701(+)
MAVAAWQWDGHSARDLQESSELCVCMPKGTNHPTFKAWGCASTETHAAAAPLTSPASSAEKVLAPRRWNTTVRAGDGLEEEPSQRWDSFRHIP